MRLVLSGVIWFSNLRLLMAIEESKYEPEHTSRVNVHDSDEVEYWTKKFGCSAAELKAAVAAVGVMSSKVRARLRAKGIGLRR